MKSLAYFSPFLPALSGIAVYSHEILQELKNYFDITLVSDDKCDEKGFKIIVLPNFMKLLALMIMRFIISATICIFTLKFMKL